MSKWREWRPVLIFAGICIIVFMVGLLVPWKLAFSYQGERVYQYQEMDEEDFDLAVLSPFGIDLKKKVSIDCHTEDPQEAVFEASYRYLHKEIRQPLVAVKEVTATYEDPVEKGEPLDPAKVKTTVTYQDGRQIPAENWTIPDGATAGDQVKVSTKYGKAQLDLDPWVRIEASYDGFLLTGMDADETRVQVTVTFDSGRKKVPESGTYHLLDPRVSLAKRQVRVSTDYGDLNCPVAVYGDTPATEKAYEEQYDLKGDSIEELNDRLYIRKKSTASYDRYTITLTSEKDLSGLLGKEIPYQDPGKGVRIREGQVEAGELTSGYELARAAGGFYFVPDPKRDAYELVANGVTDTIRGADRISEKAANNRKGSVISVEPDGTIVYLVLKEKGLNVRSILGGDITCAVYLNY